MTLSVTPSRAGFVVHRDREVVSPELALVDPVLAEAARASLVEPRSAVVDRPKLARAQEMDSFRKAAIPPSEAALPTENEPVRPSPARQSSWRVLVGVAAVTVLSLLLLDVRVHIGRTPAEAESQLAVDPDVSASGTSDSKPQEPQKPRPTGPAARQPAARRFAWAPTPGASAYHVELFRRDVRVFAADTKKPQIIVPARWALNGQRHELSAGEYRWLVWPVVSGVRASSATVQATLTIPR
jgi:hypothetical protein